MHGHDPSDSVYYCPICSLTWSSREAAEACADRDDDD